MGLGVTQAESVAAAEDQGGETRQGEVKTIARWSGTVLWRQAVWFMTTLLFLMRCGQVT